MAGTLEIPTIGSPNTTQDPKVKSNFETLNNKLNAENDWEDTALASPNNSAYRTIFKHYAHTEPDLASGTWLFSGSALILSGSTLGANPLPMFYFDDADYTVANKTQKLRLRAQIGINATKATIKFTVGLYPITVAGGADAFTCTLGTVVSGSTVEFNEPAASTITQGNSGDFTIPADGVYALGVVTSATLTNNSIAKLSAQLQTRST